MTSTSDNAPARRRNLLVLLPLGVFLAQIRHHRGFVSRAAELGPVEEFREELHRGVGGALDDGTQTAVDRDVAWHEAVVRVQNENVTRLRRQCGLREEEP